MLDAHLICWKLWSLAVAAAVSGAAGAAWQGTALWQIGPAATQVQACMPATILIDVTS